MVTVQVLGNGERFWCRIHFGSSAMHKKEDAMRSEGKVVERTPLRWKPISWKTRSKSTECRQVLVTTEANINEKSRSLITLILIHISLLRCCRSLFCCVVLFVVFRMFVV